MYYGFDCALWWHYQKILNVKNGVFQVKFTLLSSQLETMLCFVSKEFEKNYVKFIELQESSYKFNVDKL